MANNYSGQYITFSNQLFSYLIYQPQVSNNKYMENKPTIREEWQKSELSERITATEMCAINHGFPEWKGNTISDWWLNKIKEVVGVGGTDCHCGHPESSHEYVPEFSSIKSHKGRCAHCECRRYINSGGNQERQRILKEFGIIK